MKTRAKAITIFFLFLFISVAHSRAQTGLLDLNQDAEDSLSLSIRAERWRMNEKLQLFVLNEKRVRDSSARACAMLWIQDTLYTWTKEEQVKELRKNKVFLTKGRSKRKGRSLYDACLNSTDLKSDPLAELLRDSLFSKKRFGWTDGWPTIMGWHNEKYGRQLLQIVLNENSIVGYFEITRGRGKTPHHQITFYNLKGELLADDEIIKNKNLIAAVYHSNRRAKRKILFDRWNFGSTHSRRAISLRSGRYIKFKDNFKEYVIVNEQMIANWSYGTEGVKNKMKSEIQFLSQILLYLKQKEESLAHPETNPANYIKLRNQFFEKVCFNNTYYKLESPKIEEIKKEIEKALTEQTEEFSK